MDLFQASAHNEPLAARMRPRNLEEYVGQDHIVGPGRLLRRAIQADQLSSLIFYGPPGTGKTTLAQVIAGSTQSRFLTLNAVLSGVKELREAIAEARELREFQGKRTILFIDEVHRWNKSQQDALLPWVENGTVILVGATTENPYFEVNSALVSRSRIFQLKELGPPELKQVAYRAIEDPQRGYGHWKVSFQEGALEHLIKTADGDARNLLNSLQLAVETTPESFPPPKGAQIRVSLETAEESIQQKVVLYDKEGDYHYDTISAFIKSLRGSDPDAALYWMARMIRAGEDPRFILRRMIICASEDVGLADPQALPLVNAAAQAFDRIGIPEGIFPLTQAALYLATAPKSNSALAFFDALKTVDEEAAKEVPNHLKDSSRDKKGFGHGEDYSYPHAYREHWVAQAYLPKGLQGKVFYQPSAQGYEGGIQREVLKRRELQMATMVDSSEESLTYSPGDKGREAWLRRSQGGQSQFLKELREEIFGQLKIKRHHKVLIWRESHGLLLWEAWRQAPEGGVFAWFDKDVQQQICTHLSQTLPAAERPTLLKGGEYKGLLEWGPFEYILVGPWRSRLSLESWEGEWSFLKTIAKGVLLCQEPLPAQGSRLSHFLPDGKKDLSFWPTFLHAEKEVYESLPFSSLEEGKAFFQSYGVSVKAKTLSHRDPRLLTAEQLRGWFAPHKGDSLGCRLQNALSEEERKDLGDYCLKKLQGQRVDWHRHCGLFTLQLP